MIPNQDESRIWIANPMALCPVTDVYRYWLGFRRLSPLFIDLVCLGREPPDLSEPGRQCKSLLMVKQKFLTGTAAGISVGSPVSKSHRKRAGKRSGLDGDHEKDPSK